MILTIMYCEECGADLREWDFVKRRARFLENRPYCTTCRPIVEAPSSPTWALVQGPLPNGAWTLPRNRELH
jgi:hypothetical protein